MAVRKTERRLPFDLESSDLGQAMSDEDGKVSLISFQTAPLVSKRRQIYVVFVLDDTLADMVHQYKWTLENNDSSHSEITEYGFYHYIPEEEGSLKLKVELKDDADDTLASIEIVQIVVRHHPELEALVEQDEVVAPLAGNPVISREIINDFRIYMDQLAPRDADEHSSLNRLLFDTSYIGTLHQFQRWSICCGAVRPAGCVSSLNNTGQHRTARGCYIENVANVLGIY